MATRRVFAVLLVTSAFMCGILLSRLTPSLIAAATPDNVARSQLRDWLNSIRSDYEVYGFLSEAELDRAVVGESFEVYNLPSSVVEQYQPGQKTFQIMKRSQEWEYLVLVDDKPRGILRVANLDGQLQVVEFGAKDYAEQLADLRSNLAQGEAIRALVKFYPTYSAFALLQSKSNKSLVHLGSYVGVYPDLDSEKHTRYTDEEVLPKIKEELGKIKREVERTKGTR